MNKRLSFLFCRRLVLIIPIVLCTGILEANGQKVSKRVKIDSTSSERTVEILHGSQRRGSIIQSIGILDGSSLLGTPSASFVQGLPGRLTGLNIFISSGALGGDGAGIGYNLRSRGAIVMIDGVQRSFTSIDPEQIESISVLKDAVSTVMFGQRSSNGIIYVTTKKGDKGTPQISFTAQTAIQSPLSLPKPLSASQYASLYNEAQRNDWGLATGNAPQKFTATDITAYEDGSDPFGHPNVDWYKTILNPSSKLDRYNFNIQGSGPTVRYFVDLDYLSDNALLKTSDINVYNTNAQQSRYIMRSNVGADITNTTNLQVNIFGRIQAGNQPGNDGLGGIMNTLVTTPQNAYPVFNSDGSLGGNDNYSNNILGQSVYSGYKLTDRRDVSVDLTLTQRLDDILAGLYAKVQGSYNYTGVYTATRNKSFAVFTPTSATTYRQINITSDQANGGAAGDRIAVTYAELLVGYDKTFGRQKLGFTAVANNQTTYPTGGLIPEIYTDYAAKVLYGFDNRFFAEYAGSYAGYNRFRPGTQFGFFHAGGLGWNIHNEAFIQDNITCISNLKLRSSYGLTGQQNTGYFDYIQQYTVWDDGRNLGENAYWWGPNASLDRGSSELNTALANPNITWEKANKFNLGIDLGLWKNKLTLTAEYYNNRYFDLMQQRGLNTAILGKTYPAENRGISRFYGTEVSITFQNNVKEFSYFVTGNFTSSSSKNIFSDEAVQKYPYQAITGLPVGIRTGYTAIGLWQSYDEINNTANAVFGTRTSIRPGDIRYLDRNNDGVINNDDRGVIGSTKPFMFFGLNLGGKYKGFDFSLLFQGIGNNATINILDRQGEIAFAGTGGRGNAFDHNLDRWTPENPNASYPRVWLGTNTNNELPSTYWVRDVSFIRLKNAEIGYTIAENISKKVGANSIRLFVNGLNLLTTSVIKNRSFDPETYGTAYPLQRVVNFGINLKF